MKTFTLVEALVDFEYLSTTRPGCEFEKISNYDENGNIISYGSGNYHWLPVTLVVSEAVAQALEQYSGCQLIFPEWNMQEVNVISKTKVDNGIAIELSFANAQMR